MICGLSMVISYSFLMLEFTQVFSSLTVIESDYSGPSLKDGKVVTEEFVTELLKFLKDQKKLHKKYAYEVCPSFTIFCLFCCMYALSVSLNISKAPAMLCRIAFGVFHVISRAE